MTGPASEQTRAAKACQRCHQRRVKCDASRTGTPCSRCKEKGFDDCHLIQSRRGTYDRKKWRARSQQTGESSTGTQPDGNPRTASGTARLEGLQQIQQRYSSDVEIQSEADAAGNHPGFDRLAVSPPNRSASNGMQFDKQSEVSNPANARASSQNEPSWGTVFGYFLEHRKDLLDKATITYIGESFPLSIVLEDLKEGGSLLLHHPGPPSTPSEAEKTKEEHPAHMQPEDLGLLQSKRVFECPQEAILDALVSVFLEDVYPTYPIVNHAEFHEQYKAQKIPWLLLHSICFMAATYCPLSLIHSAGFSGRSEGRATYYKKAQILFDSGYEKNKLVVLQSAILLTFWGGNPNDFRNHYTWISTAVTVAETLGMHRSTAATNLPKKDKSLLKRLWWILVLRDAFCGALFGRPLRINLAQCDAETLTEDDFEHTLNTSDYLHSLYQIQVSKLALILRETINYRFNHTKRFSPDSEAAVSFLHTQLQEWRAAVPAALDWRRLSTCNIFSQTLSLLYDHHIIFIHLRQPRAQSLQGSNPHLSTNVDTSLNIIRSAAQHIASQASSLVTRSVAQRMPHEAFAAIFAAEVVLYTQMKHSDPAIAQLSRAELNLCQLVMHEIRDFWDAGPWVMQLFSTLSAKVTADEEVSAALTLSSFNEQTTVTVVSANGVNEHRAAATEWDPWPLHDMFSSFLDPHSDPMFGRNPADYPLFGSDFVG
ncbi:hypothetical protein B7463_g1443, partial [Scytalidium lignicola]